MKRAILILAIAGCGTDQPDAAIDPPDSDVGGTPTPDALIDTLTDAAPPAPDAAPAIDCALVGPLGRCDGDTVQRCDDTPIETDCDVCGYVDDTIGYGCITTTAAYRVTGTVRWEDLPLSPGQLGDPVALPARGTMVAVVDNATDELIATVSAADDGTYVAHFDATADVRIVAYSRSRATARPARVRNASGYLHAIGTAAFAPGSQDTVDVLIPADSTSSGAWNALDAAVTAMDWLRGHGVDTLSPVYLYWQLGSATGSYYQGDANELRLDGDDGHDDVVVLHELGHYIQDEYSASDNPGGAHDGSPADPRLAWGEGGATWFAIAIRDTPYYIDYASGGGWSVELEDRVHAASMSSALSQNVSEWMVAELLWDVADDTLDGDGDPMPGTDADVMDVMTGYIVSPGMTDRGHSGVDLVDWLDGWFAEHGTAQCAPMSALVRDHYGFPFDFPDC